MTRIVLSENCSLDGVVQDPTGEDGTAAGGWFTQVTDDDRAAWTEAALTEAGQATALLLGRRTYQYFAARWPDRAGPLADRLNTLSKYVVSATLRDPAWARSEVLTGDIPGQVSQLKRELAGEILVYASFQLAALLARENLIDELRLTIFPAVAGDGDRLPGGTGGLMRLRRLGATTAGDSLVRLAYAPAATGPG